MHSASPAESSRRTEPQSDALRQAYVSSKLRWAPIELPFEQFADHLQRLGWASPPLHFEALYLCAACARGDGAACGRLDRDYFPALRATIARSFGQWDFVDEVLQRTRERLLVGPKPRITTYRGEGSLSSWLRQTATHLALDLRRRERHHVSASEWHSYLELLPDSATDAPFSEAHRVSLDQLERALLQAILTLTPADRQLLYMFHVQELQAEQIGLCFGVDRSTVYRRLHQVEHRVGRASVEAASAETGITNREELHGLFRKGYLSITVDPTVWRLTSRANDDP